MAGPSQVFVAILLTATAFLGAPPPSVGNSVTYCADSAGLGEPNYASCYLDHPSCGGGCDWPEVHIRVWADQGLEGSLTPIVAGAIEFNEVCRDLDSCSADVPGPQNYGSSLFCHGYGPKDGVVLAITEVINAPWAVHMECWVE